MPQMRGKMTTATVSTRRRERNHHPRGHPPTPLTDIWAVKPPAPPWFTQHAPSGEKATAASNRDREERNPLSGAAADPGGRQQTSDPARHRGTTSPGRVRLSLTERTRDRADRGQTPGPSGNGDRPRSRSRTPFKYRSRAGPTPARSRTQLRLRVCADRSCRRRWRDGAARCAVRARAPRRSRGY
jgi:hypothetical protein